MSFASEGFVEFAQSSGVITMDMGDESIEMPYDAKLFINAAGTIAAAETDEGKLLFLSKTATQEVLTFGGRRTGAAPIEGVLLNTVASEDTEELLAAHVGALAGGAIADAEALKAGIKTAPERSAALTMKLLAQMMAAF